MKPVICFGEIMARLCPPGHRRLRQAMPGSLEVTFAGAEANAAAAIALLGGNAEFVSALPDNILTDAALADLRAAGVGVKQVARRPEGRMGLYFVEAGANQRGGTVLYDRENSAFALSGPETYPWATILAGAGWLHITGVATGVSADSARATAAAISAAKAAGVPVSFDLNFRRKLWQWQPELSPVELARRTHAPLLAEVDLLIGNPFDLADVLGETWGGDEEDDERSRLESHAELAQRAGGRFPTLRWIALTMRRQHSASCNEWAAMLLRTADGAIFAAPSDGSDLKSYRIEAIVDRVGTGDAFAGALIFALLTPELAGPERAIRFATAAGCLAHSVEGDFNFCTRAEVESLSGGNTAGHLSR